MGGVKAMGNCGDDRDRMFDPDTDWTAHNGTGVITTLPMSDEDMKAATPKPMGFVWPEKTDG